MAITKTKMPNCSKVYPIAVTAKDSFSNKEFEAKGTVTIHKYKDGMKMIFARVKTPFGIGTLKLSFHPVSGWSKDSQSMPCSHVAIAWDTLSETLARLAA